MGRRAFIASIIAGCFTPLPLFAQSTRALPRVGYLVPTRREAISALMAQFDAGMRKRGYVEGKTVTIDLRTAEDDVSRLPSLAAELVQEKVDVIVAVSPVAIVAASRATKTIPIVMAFWGGDGLLESGVVASMARPGGNVTGISMLADELEGKRFELLLQAVPSARRIGILSTRPADVPAREVARAASTAGVNLVMSPVPDQGAYGAAFAALARDRVDALMVPTFPRFAMDYQQVVAAAAAHGIPAIYEWGYMARAGGLIAYGPDGTVLEDHAAEYVARILKGAKPADMPVEQPAKFELVINQKTAETLRLPIPQSLLVRADQVIQ
jgi:putative ABC transport system substrate-binding protein